MPGTDEPGRLPALARDAGQASPSRRSVLRGAAGAGAAGLAATVLGGTAFPAAADASTRDHAAAADDDHDAVVVHVRNARTGEIDVFRGTSHTRLHDRGLAAQLLRASR